MPQPDSSRPVPPRVAPQVDDGLAALRPMLRAVAARVLRLGLRHADVEDCVAEASRRILEGRGRVREGEPVAAWAAGIVRYVAIDLQRARRRHALPVAELPEPTDPGPSPERRASTKQRLSRLAAALEDLEEGPRRAVVGFYVEGQSYAELAASLGVPMGTIATWIARSRKRLCAELGEAEGGSQ